MVHTLHAASSVLPFLINPGHDTWPSDLGTLQGLHADSMSLLHKVQESLKSMEEHETPQHHLGSSIVNLVWQLMYRIQTQFLEVGDEVRPTKRARLLYPGAHTPQMMAGVAMGAPSMGVGAWR